MGNMSYCRFENTDRALLDCQDALEGLIAADITPLSASEVEAATALLGRCADLLATFCDAAGIESTEDLLDLYDRHSKIKSALIGWNRVAEGAR